MIRVCVSCGSHPSPNSRARRHRFGVRPFKLAVGGTEETVNELLKRLPTQIAKRMIGRFPVDYKQDGEQQILQRALDLWDAQEQVGMHAM
jgi:hypothetical protein